MEKVVLYYRVSTKSQGESGLGLEAQRVAVARYLKSLPEQVKVIYEAKEVESGKCNDRPVLQESLRLCKTRGATLVISKLDRLSRDVGFLDTMLKSKIEFVCADMPQANQVMVGFMANIAQYERQIIGERTKAGLAVAKAKGKKLGNPNGAEAFQGINGGTVAGAVHKKNADEHAFDLRDDIAAAKEAGVTSYAGIARYFNEEEILTPRGKQWYPATVKNLLARLDIQLC